ncbi:MAG: type 4a pilus biogenesis protein PilO [Gammaproteobacteria bacterium]|nr:type 4a pilus biogenesis protein PilO [Gammaproteobacteria bacterium]MDH3449252.1 type 4a pilus biogenesis protein PilO [Gammaproteobacteria bacterium]
MNWDELQHHLEPDNIGTAPMSIKLGVIAVLVIMIIAAGIYFDTRNQLAVLERHEKKEVELKEEFKIKADQAAKLELYKEQLAEMEASFGALLRQLPETTEVESLLVDVSQTGLAAGLEIKKFKPSAEEKKGFYAELPISLEVTGSYHQLATFISGIAALPRIVTISDMKLEPQDKDSQATSAKLKMSATAKTYRYLQEDEQ